MSHVRKGTAPDNVLPVFPPPRRDHLSLIVGVLYALMAVLQFVLGNRLVGGGWLVVGAVLALRFRRGSDFLNPSAARRRAKANAQVEADSEFAAGAREPGPSAMPYEVRFAPPTRWTYVVRCFADDERQAVAKAHLALVYREKRGLKSWVADDGVTPINGAQLRIERLPLGSPTDEWRVNYIMPDGRYFSR